MLWEGLLLKKLRKFRNNLFNGNVTDVLGPGLTLHYYAVVVRSAFDIVRARDLRPVDRAMGKIAKKFRYRGRTFIFDCEYCDTQKPEPSFSFGIAREIYIRDCYFRWLPTTIYSHAKVVLDLGANRGAFSALMTTVAEKIVSVEVSDAYTPLIEHNFSENNFENYVVENAFVGRGGMLGDTCTATTLSIAELLDRNSITTADLVKMDIEGSEFALFESPAWLRRIRAIAMEVHPDYGDPTSIGTVLADFGFTYVFADENLSRLDGAAGACFLYGWKI